MLNAARSLPDRPYGGDADAPRVEVVSEPRLGASMDLPGTDEEVWAVLSATATALADRVDVYAIACNTLNVYATRLAALDLPAALITPQEAVSSWCHANVVSTVGLLGARPVGSLGEWSPYRDLQHDLEIEVASDPEAIHELILDIKRDGGAAPSHRSRLAALAADFRATHLMLACTELPLVATPVAGKDLIDPTDLLAAALVRRWSDSAAG